MPNPALTTPQDRALKAAQDRASFQVRLLQESQAARAQYDATGELQDPEAVAPTINALWVTVCSALNYVAPLVTSNAQLPKFFPFAGVKFRLIFPAEGMVQILDPTTEIVLTEGLIGWIDLTKVTPLPAPDSPPTNQPNQT